MKKVVSPYCKCDPCTCEPICTCGLKLVGHEEEMSWDDDRQTMKYELVERYTRDKDASTTKRK